jgi:hypothetical protein
MSFKRLDPEDFLLSSDSITSTLWTGYNPTLTVFATSSVQEASSAGLYYLNIYNLNPAFSGSEVQFDLAYGDLAGSGSAFYDNSVTGSTPTRTIYGQYRSLVLGDENAGFVFGNITSSNFYIISLERNRYKESLFPGSLSLKLTSGSNSVILTDDSLITTTNVFTDAGRIYNLVSGSAGIVYTGVNTQGWTAASGSYGWFLPDISTLILNPAALAGAGGAAGGIKLNVSRSFNTNGLNTRTLLTAIQAGASFTLNSQETITSDFVYVRARNAEFNYSENPSFISGSNGSVLYSSFINNPQTFITTVGLYNDNNELLAVAKLSKPLKKDFTKEMLLRVKLDF